MVWGSLEFLSLPTWAITLTAHMIYDATRKNVSDKRFLALAATEVGKSKRPLQ
jgi:hypothetical protein